MALFLRYMVGKADSFHGGECPSFFSLPAATPKSVAGGAAAGGLRGALPTHVHKYSDGGDHWQLGTYTPGVNRTDLGNFAATPVWEDLWNAPQLVDGGSFYASKDASYPTLGGGMRRINWGWALVPGSLQMLPRVLTFNAETRLLQQWPAEELEKLRGAAAAASASDAAVGPAGTAALKLALSAGVGKQSDTVVSFALPSEMAKLTTVVGTPAGAANTPFGTFLKNTDTQGGDTYSRTHFDKGADPRACQALCAADAQCTFWTYQASDPANSSAPGDCAQKPGPVHCPVSGRPGAAQRTSSAKVASTVACSGNAFRGVECTVDYVPPASAGAALYTVDASCFISGWDTPVHANVTLLAREKTLGLRLLADNTIAEVFVQGVQACFTLGGGIGDDANVVLSASAATTATALVWAMGGIWANESVVHAAPRVYKT